MDISMHNPYFSVEGATKRLQSIDQAAREAILTAENLSQNEKERLLKAYENPEPIIPPDYASETQIIAISIMRVKDFIKEHLGIVLEE
jgi:hypothetical protein